MRPLRYFYGDYQMTDYQLLDRLVTFYILQKQVALLMMDAMHMFEMENDFLSWYHLLEWQLAKDDLDEHWAKFKHHFPQAIGLKEGVKYE
jgi:hypothetical protein